jgi:hypothetical protein
LVPDVIVGGPLASADAVELVGDLAAGGRRGRGRPLMQNNEEIIAKTAPITPYRVAYELKRCGMYTTAPTE